MASPANSHKAKLTDKSGVLEKWGKQEWKPQLADPHRFWSIALAGAVLTGCASTIDRVMTVGDPPPLNEIKDPTTQPGYKPVRLPMPEPVAYVYQPNSLWRSGARAFFEDQRAARIGDILTVNVTIDDKAEVENATQRTRTGSDNMGIGAPRPGSARSF